jgi:hypothetical protein
MGTPAEGNRTKVGNKKWFLCGVGKLLKYRKNK